MEIFKFEGLDMVPKKGKILISSPFLIDYYFNRSVILLIQHNIEGSIGIVVNEKLNDNISLNNVLPNMTFKVHIPLFYGGPIDMDSLFYIHTLDFVEDSIPISDGIYINGNFETIMDYINKGNPINGYIRFFCGYAGWQRGQLGNEIDEGSWIVSTCTNNTIMDENYDDMWINCMNRIGGICKIWSKYPSNPLLN